MTEAFRYVLPNGKFGPVAHQVKLESFNAFYVTSTTAASTGEFSVVHGMGRIPYLVQQVLPLDVIGAQIVPLEVSRAADASRLYLKSTSTSAVIHLIVE